MIISCDTCLSLKNNLKIIFILILISYSVCHSPPSYSPIEFFIQMAGTEEDFLELLGGEVFIDMERFVKEGGDKRKGLGKRKNEKSQGGRIRERVPKVLFLD